MARLAATDKLIRREQICFHAQQAAEKALKSVLLHKGSSFPLTHDIEELLEIAANIGLTVPPEVQKASLLTPYAVETRYPGSYHDVTENDLDEALQLAERAQSWASGIIEPK
ncbi:MAG: HEPN domain-containing protein [Nitrospinae bacterium]|nr:HEPN domain-containing protein [Nitrospinota bacterium]